MGRVCKKTEEEKRANNRNSQRSFRESSKLMQQRNRERMDSLEAQNRDLGTGNEILQDENRALKKQIQALEQTVEQLRIQSKAPSPPDQSLTRHGDAAEIDYLTQNQQVFEPLPFEFDANEQDHIAEPQTDSFDPFTPFPGADQMQCQNLDTETFDPFSTDLTSRSQGTPLPVPWNAETDCEPDFAYNPSNSNLELAFGNTCDALATTDAAQIQAPSDLVSSSLQASKHDEEILAPHVLPNVGELDTFPSTQDFLSESFPSSETILPFNSFEQSFTPRFPPFCSDPNEFSFPHPSINADDNGRLAAKCLMRAAEILSGRFTGTHPARAFPGNYYWTQGGY